ncbi:MAG: hypothetical protein M1299_00455 [Firmicutes bacterium]|nr:hypothetical protein [Bacillota bacterium]MCL5038296.1 hypothetical protein [Bacillota bacterium]
MNWRNVRTRRMGGLLLLAVGGILLVKAIPGWLWMIMLGGLLGWVGWFLYKMDS